MSIHLDATATIPVRPQSYLTGTGTQVGNTNPIERTIKDILITAFSNIPNQADATATVAAIVTTLKTLP